MSRNTPTCLDTEGSFFKARWETENRFVLSFRYEAAADGLFAWLEQDVSDLRILSLIWPNVSVNDQYDIFLRNYNI